MTLNLFLHDSEYYQEMPKTKAKLSGSRGLQVLTQRKSLISGFYFHNLNAWEEGDEVVLIACKSAALNFNKIGSQFTPYLTEYRYKYYPCIYATRFNMKHGSMSEKVLFSYYGVEFPGT